MKTGFWKWRLWLIVTILVGMPTPILTAASLVLGIDLLPGTKDFLPPEAKPYHLCMFLVLTLGAISGWLGLYKLEENQPPFVPWTSAL